MRTNVTVRFNGIEQALAGLLVVSMNIPVLASPAVGSCQACQFIKKACIKNSHLVCAHPYPAKADTIC